MATPSTKAPHGRTRDLTALPPAAKLLKRQLIGVAENGEVSVAYEAKLAFTNRHGTVQGGFLAAMLDSATAFALLMALPTNKTVVTTRLDTTFVKPALPGALMAFANIQERSERSATVVAELKTLEGEVVARASADLRIIEKAS
jgi:uncharacterized protein (TIGR00369 family)